MLNDLDKSADKLVSDYKKAYSYILSLLKNQIDKGLSERQARSILREIQLILKDLDEEAYKWSYQVLPEYYYFSMSEIDKDAAQLNNVNVIGGSTSVIHQRAVEVASSSLFTDLAKNTENMNKEAKRIIREHGSELITRSTITGQSHIRTKKQMKDALVKDGVTSFTDAGGKRWNITNYTSMAVRTKSRLVHNRGTMNRLGEYREEYSNNPNFDLIQISSHNASDWCRYYEGTVWSISGTHPDYPSVDGLPNYPYESFHPNCKHVYLPYMIELRGSGKVVNNNYLNRTIKDLNKEDYRMRKAM